MLLGGTNFDKQLMHLFAYVKQTKGTALHAFIDVKDIEEISLAAYPDADLAGTFDTTKATSGGFVHIEGPNTFFPLDWFSKRQTATAHSTTEAELISASKILRESLVPLMELWSLMLDRAIKGTIYEDNMSTITVIETGYSPQLRHLQKHHRISLGLVHELCQDPDISLKHTSSETQKGDILTKGLTRPKHEPACKLIGLYPFLSSVWQQNRDSYINQSSNAEETAVAACQAEAMDKFLQELCGVPASS
jgi:hypothetical protein